MGSLLFPWTKMPCNYLAAVAFLSPRWACLFRCLFPQKEHKTTLMRYENKVKGKEQGSSLLVGEECV